MGAARGTSERREQGRAARMRARVLCCAAPALCCAAPALLLRDFRLLCREAFKKAAANWTKAKK